MVYNEKSQSNTVKLSIWSIELTSPNVSYFRKTLQRSLAAQLFGDAGDDAQDGSREEIKHALGHVAIHLKSRNACTEKGSAKKTWNKKMYYVSSLRNFSLKKGNFSGVCGVTYRNMAQLERIAANFSRLTAAFVSSLTAAWTNSEHHLVHFAGTFSRPSGWQNAFMPSSMVRVGPASMNKTSTYVVIDINCVISVESAIHT